MGRKALEIELDVPQIIRFMADRLHLDVNTDDLCKLSRLNRVQMTSQFKEKFGMTPMRFFWYMKTLVSAAVVNKLEEEKIHRIAQFMNYKNHEHFCKKIKEVLAVTPVEMRGSSGVNALNEILHRSMNDKGSILNLMAGNDPSMEKIVDNYILKYQGKNPARFEIPQSAPKNFVRLTSTERLKGLM